MSIFSPGSRKSLVCELHEGGFGNNHDKGKPHHCNDYGFMTKYFAIQVSQVVARDYESNSSRPEHNNKKQIPFIYSTLVNKLFLKPKSNSVLF